MDLLNQFKDFLFSQKDSPAKVTVKNYLSDVNHFIRWYESHYKKPFAPQLVTHETIEQYKATNFEVFSQSSIDRHSSSLRKFFKFLKLEGQISSDPFQLPASSLQSPASDPWHIKDFKNFLYVYNASHLTIKNYIIDIRQFFTWAENVTRANDTSNTKDKNILNIIDNSLLEAYKNRLINEGNFSPNTVNRKLSSLRKYLSWAEAEGLVSGISYNVSSIQKQQSADLREFAYKLQDEVIEQLPENRQSYSSFPPIRLFQKISNAGLFAFDQLLTLPFTKAFDKASYLTWLAKGRPVFKKVSSISYNVSSIKSARSFSVDNILNTKYKILNTTPKVKNLPKEFYAPLDISTKYFPWYKKTWFTLRYKRPKWYEVYHSYPIAHYFNFAILTIFMAVIGFGFYQSFFQKPATSQPALAAFPNAPIRILSFQGRLTDNQDNPISTSSALRFAIYNAQTPATGSALLWQEVDSVSPDQDGIFSVLLGNAGMCAVGQTNPTGPCGIPSWLFASNSALFLGVSVNTTPEMTPRQQLATVAYAANSETLQGLPPITQSGAGTSNVILALDSSGNLSIGGSANPIFQASGGQFTISGQPLLLTTNAGSNSNVTLSADGWGKIALNKPLTSTSNSNNIPSAVGSVEVDSLFSILATSSGQSALTINQTGGGPLISASQSGVAKFTVDGSGNTTIASGSIYSIGTNTGVSISNACVNTTGGIVTGTGTCPGGGSGGPFTELSGAIVANNSTEDFLFGSHASTSATLHLYGSAKGGTSPVASIAANTSFAGFVIDQSGLGDVFTASTAGITRFTINRNGFVSLGQAGVANGGLFLNSTGAGISAPSITTNSSGDLVLAAPQTNATVRIGSGNGNISLSLSNAADYLIADKTFTAAAGYSGSDFQFKRVITGGANSLTGAVLSVTDISSGSNTVSPDLILGNAALTSGTFTGNLLRLQVGGLDRFVVGSTGTSPVASISGQTSFAALVVDNKGVGDIFTASKSGLPLFTVKNNGQLTLGAPYYNTCTLKTVNGLVTCDIDNTGTGVNWWNQLAGALSPVNIKDDFLIGGTSTASADFAITGVGLSTNQVNASLSGRLIVMPNNGYGGNVGIGTTSPTALLDVAGTASVGGQLTFRSGTAQIQSTADQTLTLGGNTTGQVVLSGFNGAVNGITFAGYTTCTLKTTATGVVTCGTDNTGTGVNWWNQLAGALSPVDTTNDLLIGSTATSSAEFAFTGLGLATHQTQASFSGQFVLMPNNGYGGNATISGALTLGAFSNPVIQTTNNQGLTIGGNTTGGVVIRSFDQLVFATPKRNNLFAGEQAGNLSLTGTYNVGLGYQAGTAITSGSDNILIGSQAGWQITTGSDNVAVGYNAGYALATSGNSGNNNTLLGSLAGQQITTGDENVCIGYNSCPSLNGAEANNTFVGAESYSNSGISNSTSLGWNTFVGGTNSTAIGFDANVLQDNSMVLGSIAGVGGATASVRVGIGTTAPTATLDLQGGNWGGNAALIINQNGSSANDIFTASASGVTQFRITNSSGVYAKSFHDSDNSTIDYYLDPAAGVSLKIAGDASTSADLSFYGASTAHQVNILDNGSLNFVTSPGGDAIANTALFIRNNGNIGIGTTAPASKLSIGDVGNSNWTVYANYTAGTGGSAIVGSATGNGIGIQGVSGSNNGVRGYSDTGHGVYGESAGANASVYAYNSSTGTALEGESTSGYGGYFSSVSGYALITGTGNVGIGTTTPRALLDVAGSASISGSLSMIGSSAGASNNTSNVLFYDSNFRRTGGIGDYSNTNSDLGIFADVGNIALRTGGSERVTIDTAGNVGIGTTAPTDNLVVQDSIATPYVSSSVSLPGPNSGPIATITNQSNTAGIGAFTQWGALNGSGVNNIWYAGLGGSAGAFGGPFVIGNRTGATAYNERLRIDSAGNVGIGTTGPNAMLEVTGGSTRLDKYVELKDFDTGTFDGTTIGSAFISRDFTTMFFKGGVVVGQYSNGAVPTAYSANGAFLTTGATALAAISGNVGIGTTTPTAMLDIAGAASLSGDLAFTGTGTNYVGMYNNSNLSFLRSVGGPSVTTSTLFLSNTGAVGIGSTVPLPKLLVDASGSNHTGLAATALEVDAGGATSSFYTAQFRDNSANVLMMIRADGNIGIGTTAPGWTLDVQDTQGSTASASIWNLSANQTAGNCSTLCHTGLIIKLGAANSSAVANTRDRFINFTIGNGTIIGKIQGNGTNAVLSSTGGDYAEWFKKANLDEVINPGDLICYNANGDVTRCDNNNSRILGVASDSYFLLGNGQESYEGNPNYMVVGLIGQIKTTVTAENGAIQTGDLLTYSSTNPGVAIKATKAGFVIGRALQSGTAGRINAYINPTWYDPDVQLTSIGDLNLVDQTASNAASQANFTIPHYFTLNDTLGNPITKIGAFAEIAVAKLKVGLVDAQQITTNALSVTTENVTIGGQSLRNYIASIVSDVILNTKYLIPNTDIISPIASIDEVHTNLISPLAQDSKIALKLDDTKFEILNTKYSTGSAVSSFDNQGNATFSGQLTSNSLNTGNATISGTLRAGRILASDIVGLNIQAGTISANYITNVTNIYNSSPSGQVSGSSYLVSSNSGNFGLIASQASPDTNYNIQNTGYISIATFSSQLAYVENLNAATATFAQGLMSFGPTSLSDTSIVGQLSIDGNLILASNSINVLGSDLQLQPLRQGGLSIMAGLFHIDTNGNLTVGGDATFAKNVTVKGNLAVNVISPIPGNDLTFKLATGSGILNTKYKIQDTNGSDILSINQQGDLIASGAGTFGKLNLSFVQPAFALSTTEVVATGSAGTAQINAHQTEITIDNPLVTDKSLIYVTPKSNQVIYLMRQIPGVSFTVGISNPLNIDVPFNWIIVN